jgi:DNA-binding response OmpR family regulator
MARILVIDDEPNICRMLQLTLRAAGHEVEVAYDGLEGIAKFGNGDAWDLVLLDQRMPDVEGLYVLKELKKRDPDAKIIMITAFGTIDLAVSAMKLGATDFLRKPFTAKTLRGAVDAALNRETVSTAESHGLTYGFTTVNGYHIEFQPDTALYTGGKFEQTFTVTSPSGEQSRCKVVLLPHIMELVKAYADREQFAGGSRFWQALCEEALANYLWQHAELPPNGVLQVDELTTGMRRWIDAVLTTV